MVLVTAGEIQLFEVMKNQKAPRYVLIVVFALLAGVGSGCGKKAETGNAGAQPAAAQQEALSASTIPGANDVIAALNRKDYDAVVAGIFRAQQTTAGRPDQQVQFATLVDEVKIRLLEEAPNNPKAKEALAALRRITGGR